MEGIYFSHDNDDMTVATDTTAITFCINTNTIYSVPMGCVPGTGL